MLQPVKIRKECFGVAYDWDFVVFGYCHMKSGSSFPVLNGSLEFKKKYGCIWELGKECMDNSFSTDNQLLESFKKEINLVVKMDFVVLPLILETKTN